MPALEFGLNPEGNGQSLADSEQGRQLSKSK